MPQRKGIAEAVKVGYSIEKNDDFTYLISVMEAAIHKLTSSGEITTNSYLANILGLYSYGKNEKHKPDYLVWNLLHISNNIKQMGKNYLVIDSSKLNEELIQLSIIELYELAQLYLGKLMKQVYDLFENGNFILNCDVCKQCYMYTNIKDQNDFVSWSILYMLYNAGHINRVIKNEYAKRTTYKWTKNKNNIPFVVSDIVQRQIDYKEKISYAHYETLIVLKELKEKDDRIIEIVSEHTDKRCKDKKCLPFDVVIDVKDSKNNIVKIYVELDGEQHFRNTFYSKGEKLNYIQDHDKIKTNFVIKNNELLVRIPYSDNHKIKKILTRVLDNMIDLKGFYTTDLNKYKHLGIEGNKITI